LANPIGSLCSGWLKKDGTIICNAVGVWCGHFKANMCFLYFTLHMVGFRNVIGMQCMRLSTEFARI